MKNHFLNLARCSLLFLLFFVGQQLLAQKTITGIVTDGDLKEPIIGGTILVKGQSTGTVTDLDGKFTIKASDKDVLVFSYIGMDSQEVPVLNKNVINIILKTNATQLSEVVAIGYGTVKKSDLTGSVALVSSKDLTRNPSSSAMKALQGKAPGVLVFSTGQPGGGATIRIRGVGSINNNSDPIYIVDGVQQGNINNIEPQDIENMQILKDASATAIYGANGSNGVVIINTKRGKSGKVQVSFNSYLTVNLAPEQYDVMNAQQYSNFYSSELFNSNGLSKTYTDSKGVTQANQAYAYSPEFRQKYYGDGWEEGTNWQDLLFNDGVSQNYSLSLSGGGENSNFTLAMSYLDEVGTIINNNSKNYNVRINSDFKLGKYIKIGENVNLNYINKQSPMTVQTSIYDLIASPLMKVNNSYYQGGYESPQTPYWEDGSGTLQQGTYPTGTLLYTNTVGNDKPNPIAAPSMGNSKSYGLIARASAYMQIDFTDWLMYKVTPSIEIGNYRSRSWMPMFTGNRTTGSAALKESYSENIALNLDNQLSFTKKFNDVHNVQATLVYQTKQTIGNSISGTKAGYDFEQLNVLSNGGTTSVYLGGSTSDYRMLSYLGRLMYDYKGKYYVTGSLRSDGVSVFGPTQRRGNFASASGAWKINEDFFKDVRDIDALKIRVGWGQTGNSNMSGGYYMYTDNLNATNMFSPVFGTSQQIASAQYVFYSMGNEDIHWEAAEMINSGVDLTMYGGKLQASVEYYIKKSNDLLVQIPISASFGRNAKPWYNLGDIQNKGLELSLQWRDHIGDFNYGVVSNFTTTKNEVTYLPVTDITSDYNRTVVGHSVGSLYGYVSDGIIQLNENYYAKGTDGEWQKELNTSGNWNGNYLGYKYAKQDGNTPQPGDLKFTDLNGDGNVDSYDRTIIGKTIPSFNYSLGLDCSYKNFDFNVFLYGVADFEIYNSQRASLSSMNSQDMQHNKLNSWAENHWTLQNASTTDVRVDPSNINKNDRISSFWVEDGSFLRLKDIQVGYAVPKKSCAKLGIASLRLYVNASNVYCFTSYKGKDPEGFISTSPLSGGTDDGGYTLPHSFTGGFQIGF